MNRALRLLRILRLEKEHRICKILRMESSEFLEVQQIFEKICKLSGEEHGIFGKVQYFRNFEAQIIGST